MRSRSPLTIQHALVPGHPRTSANLRIAICRVCSEIDPDRGGTRANTARLSGPQWLEAVVPIQGHEGHIIGTGVAVAPGRVMTALHVIDLQPLTSLQVAALPVVASATLPWRHYRGHRETARESYHRARTLTGYDAGTVDLALLAVPELDVPVLPIRRTPIEDGELLALAGYPNGRWHVTVGPVTSHDSADFVAHVLLGPGISGAPALDTNLNLAGLITMDHATAGAIAIGPQLLATFLTRTSPLLAHL